MSLSLSSTLACSTGNSLISLLSFAKSAAVFAHFNRNEKTIKSILVKKLTGLDALGRAGLISSEPYEESKMRIKKTLTVLTANPDVARGSIALAGEPNGRFVVTFFPGGKKMESGSLFALHLKKLEMWLNITAPEEIRGEHTVSADKHRKGGSAGALNLPAKHQ